MPHLIWLSPLHDNAVICVIVLMAGVTLTLAVKNGWGFLAYLCEGTGDWRLIRERWGPLLMCEAISSCGPRPLSGDVSLKDMGGKKSERTTGTLPSESSLLSSLQRHWLPSSPSSCKRSLAHSVRGNDAFHGNGEEGRFSRECDTK